MSVNSEPKGTAPKQEEFTIMFADVVDSTGLYEKLGDVDAQFVIAQVLGIVRDMVQRNHGRVIKSAGDDILCLFHKADYALNASISIQETLADEMIMDDLYVSMHIGIHSGMGLLTEGDVFGDTVNVAARVTNAAKSGQILTTKETIARLSPGLDTCTRRYDEVRVKGRMRQVEIFEVMWRNSSDVTGVLNLDRLNAVGTTLHLRHRGREYELTSDKEPFIIGREPECELFIEGTMISRQHAVIEYYRSKFVLRDQSTNGTYIRPLGGQAFYIRREEIPLMGEGEISLGKLVDDRPIMNIFYKYV